MKSLPSRIFAALIAFTAVPLFSADTAPAQPEGVSYGPILPSATDPGIKEFDDPHLGLCPAGDRAGEESETAGGST